MPGTRSSTIKPAQLRAAFEARLSEKGLSANALSLAQAIVEFRDFFEQASVRGRPQNGTADELLFQTGNPPWSEAWSVNLTRQLYSRGRGQQLGLTFFFDTAVAPWPGYVTSWTKDHASLDAWAEAAEASLAELGVQGVAPTEVQLSLDAF